VPPALALLLTLVLIAALLFCELRRHPSVSASLWIPTLLFLIIGSRPVSAWLGSDVLVPGANGEGNVLDRSFYFCLIVAAWLVASRRRVRWRRLFAANGWLMLFYLYFAMSVAWSPDPSGSFKRVVKDFGTVFVVSVILSESDPLQAIRAVYLRCACVLIPLSALFVKYYPDLGRAYSIAGYPTFTGVTTQKNSLGELLMVVVLVLVWDYLETRVESRPTWMTIPWDRLLLLLMSLWLLNVSESKTAMLCLAIGVCLFLRTGPLASRLASGIVLVVALSAPLFLLFLPDFAPLLAPLVQILGRNITFTGRTEIWEHIDWTTVNPFFGAGFYTFWESSAGSAIRDAVGMHWLVSAHNGYLDVYLDGGIVALVLLFILLLSRGTRMIGTLHLNRFQRFRFAVLIMALFYNLSESTFARLIPIWFTTLLVLIDFPDPHKALAGQAAVAASRGRPARQTTPVLPRKTAPIFR
jgi:exopolysaccharide production protein ExoQ